jgi:hypothetical protein
VRSGYLFSFGAEVPVDGEDPPVDSVSVDSVSVDSVSSSVPCRAGAGPFRTEGTRRRSGSAGGAGWVELGSVEPGSVEGWAPVAGGWFSGGGALFVGRSRDVMVQPPRIRAKAKRIVGFIIWLPNSLDAAHASSIHSGSRPRRGSEARGSMGQMLGQLVEVGH